MTLWQLAALYIGHVCAKLLYMRELAIDKKFIGLVIAAVIFFCLGVRLIVKAIRNERVDEHREDEIAYTLLTGVAFGFLSTNVMPILIMVICLTVAVVVAGLYTGYHFGFEYKTKAYVAGAVLLWIAGFDVIFRYIMG